MRVFQGSCSLLVSVGALRREDDCHGFHCKIGCVSLNQVCDYVNDCGDNGDEIGCGKVFCLFYFIF